MATGQTQVAQSVSSFTYAVCGGKIQRKSRIRLRPARHLPRVPPQSRINRGKPDSSVYGAATDGLTYVFVSITHEGVLRFSKQFDVMAADLPIILGCLRYILDKAIAMSPISSPKTGVQTKNQETDNDIDEEFNLYDDSYMEGEEDYNDVCSYEMI